MLLIVKNIDIIDKTINKKNMNIDINIKLEKISISIKLYHQKSDINIEIRKTFDNEMKKFLFTPRGDSILILRYLCSDFKNFLDLN